MLDALSYERSWYGCLRFVEDAPGAILAALGIDSYTLPMNWVMARRRGDRWAIGLAIGLLTSKTRSLRVGTAVKRWCTAALSAGIPFPPQGCCACDAATFFLNSSDPEVSELKASTRASYAAAVRAFAVTVLGEGDISALSRGSPLALTLSRCAAFDADPSGPKKIAVPRAVFSALVSDASCDLALRAVVAVAWDSASRLGDLLVRPSRAKDRDRPTPISAVDLSSSDGSGARLMLLSKTSKKYEPLYLSSDPESPFFHPRHLGGVSLLGELLRRCKGKRRSSGLWSTRSGRRITPKLITRTLVKYGAPALITGHCVRVSSATDLFLSKSASFEAIMVLGRWQSVSSVRKYIRAAVMEAGL